MNPTRILRPSHRGAALMAGVVGGALGGLCGLMVLVVGTVMQGRAALVAPNAVGATIVRWLQIGQQPAFDNFYPDATLSGLLLAVLSGALIGAPLAALVSRFPEDHPVAWGLLAGAVLWAVTRFWLAPALDPALVRVLGAWTLAMAFLTFGLVVGLWLAALRPLFGHGRRADAAHAATGA